MVFFGRLHSAPHTHLHTEPAHCGIRPILQGRRLHHPRARRILRVRRLLGHLRQECATNESPWLAYVARLGRRWSLYRPLSTVPMSCSHAATAFTLPLWPATATIDCASHHFFESPSRLRKVCTGWIRSRQQLAENVWLVSLGQARVFWR